MGSTAASGGHGQDVVVADTPPALDAALAGIDDLAVVGVDVERADSDRYWRAAALIQLGGDGRAVLVDPLALGDLSALGSWLLSRVTVLHAMENDLAPLQTAGCTLGAAEDTALAAAMLGLPTGLGDLLTTRLDVDLADDKQVMQRADWSARPLTARMIDYAAEDVVHLPALWRDLSRALEEAGRTAWYVEERDWVRHQPPAEERRHWGRTRGLSRLDPRARARARSLWEVREHLARDTDTAPGRILGDRVLLDLASQPATGPRELGERGVRRAAVRRFGAALLEALASPVEVEPGRRHRRPVQDRDLLDRLRAARTASAEQVGLDPGFVCPNRVLPAAVSAEPRTPQELRSALELRDWQWDIVRDAFTEAVFGDGVEPR